MPVFSNMFCIIYLLFLFKAIIELIYKIYSQSYQADVYDTYINNDTLVINHIRGYTKVPFIDFE
jgi:hypothetical protein